MCTPSFFFFCINFTYCTVSSQPECHLFDISVLLWSHSVLSVLSGFSPSFFGFLVYVVSEVSGSFFSYSVYFMISLLPTVKISCTLWPLFFILELHCVLSDRSSSCFGCLMFSLTLQIFYYVRVVLAWMGLAQWGYCIDTSPRFISVRTALCCTVGWWLLKLMAWTGVQEYLMQK
jgi:hypothetical protein